MALETGDGQMTISIGFNIGIDSFEIAKSKTWKNWLISTRNEKELIKDNRWKKIEQSGTND